MKLPTDLEILSEIYEEYYPRFVKFDRTNPDRDAKIYVPIDTDLMGKRLGVDGDIIFGRLYYHFNNKYSFEKDGASTDFFALRQGKDIHLVQFPYLASVLAELRADKNRHTSNFRISLLSVIIALISILISVFN